MLSVGSKTMGDWAEALAVCGASPTIVGSPQSVAGELQKWVAETGTDETHI